MAVLVWVSEWQQQCCGTAFAVGDQVSWTLDADPDLDWIRPALAADVAAGLSHAEEHHGKLPEDTPETLGTVTSIRTVRCRYPARPADGESHPLPGSAVLTSVSRVEGSEATPTKTGLTGYVVELRLDDVLA